MFEISMENVKEKIMTHPKVTVILPVYNVEEYLRQCLDSAVS